MALANNGIRHSTPVITHQTTDFAEKAKVQEWLNGGSTDELVPARQAPLDDATHFAECHAAKRFIGLAIVVRGKDRGLLALASSSFAMNG